MNSDQIHKHNRHLAIEKLIEDYGIEEVIAGLSDYCQTKAITTSGKTKEFWHDVAEALQKVTDGWVDE